MKHHTTLVLALAALCAIQNANADCAGPNLADKKRSYERAQAYEKEGKQELALRSYAAAQGYACEPHNPYEADAARRAAPLGMKLGGAAEKSGEFRRAYELYEAGGHFAAADRALVALARANPDAPGVFAQVLDVLQDRSLPALQSNHEAALAVTGPYAPNPAHLEEVLGMPAQGAERAFQKEAAAFSEQYLREYVQLIQSRPDDPTDFAALQAANPAHQAFAQKWKHDPLKTSLDALKLVHAWSVATPDAALRTRLDAQRKQRLEQRAATLTQKYSGAPELLESAVDYYHGPGVESGTYDGEVVRIRNQAERLGDDANAKGRYMLAVEYYGVAGQEAKAQAARATQRRLVEAKMQPSIDAAQRHAEELRKQYSDPAKVQSMREQAEAMRKSLQQQQQSNAKANAKRADELESELGL
jgi:hypothetical protein